MVGTFHTLVYAAYRANISELVTIRQEIELMYGKEFIKASEADLDSINDVIRENINMIMPDLGMKIERLIKLAEEHNIEYHPSETNMKALLLYIDKKGGKVEDILNFKFPNSMGGGGGLQMPMQPPPQNMQNMNMNMPPQGQPGGMTYVTSKRYF